MNDFKVTISMEEPTDTVSCIKWSPTQGMMFAAGTWDGKLKIYSVQQQGG